MVDNNTHAISKNRSYSGFTLIELMVVVAVIAILVAVGLPSYQSYIIRANRSAAQQFMLGIASRQEQYLLDARTYTATLGAGGLGLTPSDWDCTSNAAQCTNSRYTITVAVPTATTYTITATATGAQVSDGNLMLDNLGTKTPADKWK